MSNPDRDIVRTASQASRLCNDIALSFCRCAARNDLDADLLRLHSSPLLLSRHILSAAGDGETDGRPRYAFVATGGWLNAASVEVRAAPSIKSRTPGSFLGSDSIHEPSLIPEPFLLADGELPMVLEGDLVRPLTEMEELGKTGISARNPKLGLICLVLLPGLLAILVFAFR